MIINDFDSAQQFLFNHIPKQKSTLFPGDWGLQRTKYLLQLLGNPQDTLKVIHIAGTSGKGSTAYIISEILKSFHFTIGLHISPHISDIRERFQINNLVITEKEFQHYVERIQPFVEQVARSEYGAPTYFEITAVLAYVVFHDKKVNYAVIETGMGGLLDATNVMLRSDKVCVITKIGLDHTDILGKTLSLIAAQKAGIIQEKNTVFTLFQRKTVREIMEKTVKTKNANIHYIYKKAIKNIRSTDHGIVFDMKVQHLSLKRIELGLSGVYQAENCAVAITVCFFLSNRDGFEFHEKLLRNQLKKLSLAGRMQIFSHSGITFIADGAHNPQKMATFCNSLVEKFPNEKFSFLIAFKTGKDYRNMMKYIIPIASAITLTTFFSTNQDLLRLSEKPECIARILAKIGFKNSFIESSATKALDSLEKSHNKVVVTGSFYLLSELYSIL